MMVYNPGSGDRLYQAVKGMSSRIYTRYTTDGETWSNWRNVNGETDRDVNMMVYNPGSGDRLYQAVKGMSNRIYTRNKIE